MIYLQKAKELMIKSKFIIFIILYQLLSSCHRSNSAIIENFMDRHPAISIGQEIDKIECKDWINDKFSQMYDKSFKRIYSVNSSLDKRFYTEEETEQIDLFIAFDKKDLSGWFSLFGFDKENSDFVFVNYFEDFEIISLDGHMRYNLDIDTLISLGCLNLKLKDEVVVNNTFYENTYFEYNKDVYYKVDSILFKKEHPFLFDSQTVIRIENNLRFITEKDTLNFSFDNYLLNITNSNKDTSLLKIVSQSKTGKILLDLETETLYFLSRHEIPKMTGNSQDNRSEAH